MLDATARDSMETERSDVSVADREFNHLARRTAVLTVGLAAALVFGILVLAGGDWLPGTIIIVASLVGLAGQAPTMRTLWRQHRPPSPSNPVR
jgi:hypothetical protein